MFCWLDARWIMSHSTWSGTWRIQEQWKALILSLSHLIGRAPCRQESSLEDKFSGKMVSEFMQRQLLLHTHIHITTWMWYCITFGCGLLQVSKLTWGIHPMTCKHHPCSAFPSASFRVGVIAAFTSLAHILIMRLLSRLWPLAKIAQNQLRQLLSYRSKHKESVLRAGLPSAEWVMCETAQPWNWAFQETHWPSQTSWARPSVEMTFQWVFTALTHTEVIKIEHGLSNFSTESKTQVLNVAAECVLEMVTLAQFQAVCRHLDVAF